ncbi:FH2 domain-containing protein 1-like [Ruditapes philippinarum]|uniref:FH2 domain-containing protein 1-like n=1 Tax=Ruditapes philippinarum TaxID=129788 RepID=UPI00295AA2A5|nr:FH2 domain-containing protein 1-like [Ruditapes philippinarum]
MQKGTHVMESSIEIRDSVQSDNEEFDAIRFEEEYTNAYFDTYFENGSHQINFTSVTKCQTDIHSNISSNEICAPAHISSNLVCASPSTTSSFSILDEGNCLEFPNKPLQEPSQNQIADPLPESTPEPPQETFEESPAKLTTKQLQELSEEQKPNPSAEKTSDILPEDSTSNILTTEPLQEQWEKQDLESATIRTTIQFEERSTIHLEEQLSTPPQAQLKEQLTTLSQKPTTKPSTAQLIQQSSKQITDLLQEQMQEISLDLSRQKTSESSQEQLTEPSSKCLLLSLPEPLRKQLIESALTNEPVEETPLEQQSAPVISKPLSSTPLPPPAPPLPSFDKPNTAISTCPNIVSNIPTPSVEMKQLSWVKIPDKKYEENEDNVWRHVHAKKDPPKIDISNLETLFSKKEEPTIKVSGNVKATQDDSKKSFPLEIFFKSNPAHLIVEGIKSGHAKSIRPDRLSELLNLIPGQDELGKIKEYDGSTDNLSQVQRFLYNLAKIPNLHLRIEMIVFKETYDANDVETICQDINILSSVCEMLMNNESLVTFLGFVLYVGNIINKGNPSGNAVGFYIRSHKNLLMMKMNMDTGSKSTKEMNLLHYLVNELIEKNTDALKFAEEFLDPLRNAPRLHETLCKVESLRNNANRLQKFLDEEKEMKEEKIFEDYSHFHLEVNSALEKIENRKEVFHELSGKLAQYFCEDKDSFNFDEFVKDMESICQGIAECKKDLVQSKAKEGGYLSDSPRKQRASFYRESSFHKSEEIGIELKDNPLFRRRSAAFTQDPQ